MRMMDMKKRNAYHWLRTTAVLLLALILTLSGAGTARAEESLAEKYTHTDCSITLTMQYDESGKKKDMVGGELSLYTVATVKSEHGYYWDITEGKFADVKGISDIPSMTTTQLNKNNSSLAKAMEGKAAKVKAEQTVKIENGKAAFKDLKCGLYLIVQSKPSEGKLVVSSFLISIPDEDGQIYITGNPKPGIEKPKENVPETTPPKTPPKSKLPQTGQLWWPVPVLGCAGILLIAAGIYGKRRQKRSANGQ